MRAWLCANRLSLNTDKTKFVLFYTAQKHLTNNISLRKSNEQIEQINSMKYLGVLIDSQLNWKDHILNMSKKISKSIGIIWKLRHFVNSQILIQLYYALIYPFLTYDCMVWGSTYAKNVKPLEILQKRSIRIINFAKFDAYTAPLFAKFKFLKLQDIITLYTACFMHNFHNSKYPNAFNCFFTSVGQRHSYNTRLPSKSTFVLPKGRTNYGKFNIRFFGPKVWNDIEEPLKTLGFQTFKRKLKLHLLNTYK